VKPTATGFGVCSLLYLVVEIAAPAQAPGTHEPAGFTKAFDTPFTAPLSTTPNSEGWAIGTDFGLVRRDPSLIRAGADASQLTTDPTGGLTTQWRQGGPSGNQTVGRVYYRGPLPAANHGYLYQRITFKIDPGWTDNGNSGAKFFWTKASGSSINHGWRITTNGQPRIAVFLQGKSSVEWRSLASYTKGAWHVLELLYTPNTPGSENGGLDGWMDGAPIIWTRTGEIPTSHVANLKWFGGGDTPRFTNFYFDFLYGGGNHTPPHDLYTWVDHFYCSMR
jgi:hypothetical protein